MTHRALGVRAERVVAHGPAPRGFLVHGGEATLWTAYLNSGVVPRGEAFASIVREIAERAGVDTSPIDRPRPRDRRADLFEQLRHTLSHGAARERGSPGAGVPGATRTTRRRDRSCRTRRRSPRALHQERSRSGRLLRARDRAVRRSRRRPMARPALRGLARRARNSPHPLGTLARRLRLLHAATSTSRSKPLRPAALRPLRRPSPAPDRSGRELAAGRGARSTFTTFTPEDFPNVAAVGGARLQPGSDPALRTTWLRLDRARLRQRRSRSRQASHARSKARAAPRRRQRYACSSPSSSATPRTPTHSFENTGSRRSAPSSTQADCAISWHALELTRGVTPQHDAPSRRAALARAGNWLGTLPARSRSNRRTQSAASPTSAATRDLRSSGRFALDSGMAGNGKIAPDW